MSSIYKRGKLWQIKFNFNFEAHQKSLKTKNKTRAQYLKKQIDKYLEIGEFPPIEIIMRGETSKSYTLIEYIGLIEEEVNNNISHSPDYRRKQRDYLNHLRKFIKIENIKFFRDVDSSTPIKYRNWRLNMPAQKKGKSISPKTVRDELIYFKNNIFERALDEDLVIKNPFKNATKGLKVYKNEKMPFTKNEVENLISHAPNKLHRDLYLALYYTGSRFGEVANLEWVDIDFDKEKIHIMNKDTHKTKTRKSRVTFIHPHLKKVLLERKELARISYVFPSPQDSSRPVKDIRMWFNKTRDELGIDSNKTLHCFRHAFATELLEAGV